MKIFWFLLVGLLLGGCAGSATENRDRSSQGKAELARARKENLFEEASQVLLQAIQDSIFPGAQVVVVSRSELRRGRDASEARQVRFTAVLLMSPVSLERMKADGDYRAVISYDLFTLIRFGGETVDLIPAQSEYLRREGLSLTMPSGHWSPRGNCLIAAELARQLADTSQLELAANVSLVDRFCRCFALSAFYVAVFAQIWAA